MSEGAKPLGDKIVGYRKLTNEQLEQMNTIKSKAQEIGELVESLTDVMTVDQRWLNIGKTDIQKGFMALVRSIAKPESF